MLARVNELAAMLKFRKIDFNFLPRSALFKGERLRNRFHEWSEGATFADTLIPCWMVATDVAFGDEIVINRGPLADAVRASMSIPGAMNPWPIGDRRCIDGAVVNPMPASVLRNAGLRLVIGSNVAGQELPAESDPHLLQIMSRIVNSMEREMIKAQLPLVDVLIRPRGRPGVELRLRPHRRLRPRGRAGRPRGAARHQGGAGVDRLALLAPDDELGPSRAGAMSKSQSRPAVA